MTSDVAFPLWAKQYAWTWEQVTPSCAADVHYFTADRLARRRALGEHVQKTLPPSNVRSRLHNLVAHDDINSYLDLV